MTNPEKIQTSQELSGRGTTPSAQSMRIFDAAQEAIEETRRLLNETSSYTNTQRGQQE